MSDNLSIEELSRKADEISHELVETRESIKALKEKRTEILNQLAKLRGEKQKLLDEIRSIKSKIREVREERRKLIEEYRNLTKEKRESILQLKAIKDLLSSKSIEIQNLTREVKIPISVIKQKVEEIEWTIQTSVLTPERENSLIRKLKAYTMLLNKAMSIREKKEEALELRATYLSLRTKVSELVEKTKKLRGAIDEKTKKLSELSDQLNQVVSKYDNMKKELEAKRKELEEANKELTIRSSKLNALRSQYQEILDAIEKAKRMQILSEKKSKVAKDVEKREKKRLSIEELKIMYGDVEDLDET